jgi:uncharacterized membrane protein
VTLYEFLLFVHIACAVIWVGGGAMVQFMGLRVLASGDPSRLAQFGGDIEALGMRVLTPAALGAVLSGFCLVWEAELWSLGEDWIVIGLVLFAITFLAGFGFFGPESGRIKKQVESQGAAVALPRVRRLIVLMRIDQVVLFLIIFDMAVKPSFSDGWTIAGGLAAAVLLAALFTLPTLRAKPA